jgi:hypothetical protein
VRRCACGETFTGRYRKCDNCRKPPKPCIVPGCQNPKVPGPGSKSCQEHRDNANERKLQRLRDQNRLSNGICQMAGCEEPKLTGRGHKHCARHSAEAPQRELAQIKRRARERKYGVTHDVYLAMLAAQGGVCAICRNGNDNDRQLSVDHDHVTGVNRDLLCDCCNPLLGYARDSIAILEAAIEYLKRHQVLSPPIAADA